MSNVGEMKIIYAGPQCLLQDLGRTQVQSMGFCQSGAADEHSFLWANKLLGNSSHCAALEIAFGPFEVEFHSDTCISICGAADTILLNEKKIRPWSSFPVCAGDRLRIKHYTTGVFTYLAIAEGFQSESPFTSKAMAPREKTGPDNGQPFKNGKILEYLEQDTEHAKTTFTPGRFIPNYDKNLTLEFIPSPNITPSFLTAFLNTNFFVQQNSSRMAYRLKNKTGLPLEATSIRSSATPFGCIQYTPNGEALVLLKDRQTIGGYPSLGCITHHSAFALSQCRGDSKINFSIGNILEAQANLKRFYQFFGL